MSEYRLLERQQKLRTSVGDGESKAGEPDGGIVDSGEGLAGGKEEISGDCVGGDRELEEDVSEGVEISEAGCAGDRFGEKDNLEH